VFERIGFDRIIGQKLAKDVLSRAVREAAPTHAYLFLGLQSTGKTTTALEFAMALNCENPAEGNACGKCALCRSMEHGNSPDVRVWSPDGRDTTIDQMREMRDQANFKPLRGKWRVNIVEQADTLNEASANSILKLLEEPPDYLINILCYRNAATMLPTIRSRCQLLRFTQVDADELASRLVSEMGVGSDEAAFLAAYSQGCPGKAIELIGNEEFFARRGAIIDAAGTVSAGNGWAALKVAEVLRGEKKPSKRAAAADSGKPAKSARDLMIETLDILAVWYRDILAVKLQGDEASIVNSDKLDEVRSQSNRYASAGRLASAVEAILYTKRAIIGNASAQIATEALAMRLMG
jgi:DNA polymerase-3 subunit delta'